MDREHGSFDDVLFTQIVRVGEIECLEGSLAVLSEDIFVKDLTALEVALG